MKKSVTIILSNGMTVPVPTGVELEKQLENLRSVGINPSEIRYPDGRILRLGSVMIVQPEGGEPDVA